MDGEDQQRKPDESGDESGDDWGDDWESAFQAEEEITSDNEIAEEPQSDDLDESWDEVLSVAAEPESPTSSSRELPEEEHQETDSQSSEDIEEQTAGPGIIEKLKGALSPLPLYVKISTAIIPIAILIFILLPIFAPKDMETKVNLPVQQNLDQKKSTLPAAPEKVRAKWPLTSFFIPVTSDKEVSVVFLNLDLTMILLLSEDEELPSENVSKARDLVYQFFINRPLYELRRFSLARGEMNKKLRSWIRKQWPDINLETIIFDHYELI